MIVLARRFIAMVWSLRKFFTQIESRDWDDSDVPEGCGVQGPRWGLGSFWFSDPGGGLVCVVDWRPGRVSVGDSSGRFCVW